MNQNNRQLDSLGIPVWIGEFCNQHQTLHLSDTRTYRLLTVIYRSVIEMGIPVETTEDDREDLLFDFMAWFHRLEASSMDVWGGLMWVYQVIGEELSTHIDDKRAVDDERLSHMLLVFVAISESAKSDPSFRRYFAMIGNAWICCEDDGYLESLYRGFVATLVAHSRYELKSLADERGISESELNEVMRGAFAFVAKPN